MSFEKTGIVSSGNIYESDAMNFPTQTISYTPAKDTNNSCMDTLIEGDFEIGKQYHVECLVTWRDFDASSTAGTFRVNLQGAQYTTEKGWGWFASNCVTDPLNRLCSGNNLTSLVLGSTSGSKLLSTTITNQTCTKYRFGCRTNYSNGKGWIQLSNIKIIPAEYFVSTPPSKIRLFTLRTDLSLQEKSWSIKSLEGGDLI